MSGNATGLALSPRSSSPDHPGDLNQNPSLKGHGTIALGDHWGSELVNQ